MAYTIKQIDTTDQYAWLSSLKTILDELDVDYFDSTVLTVDREASSPINKLDIKKGDRVICEFNCPSAITASGNKVFFYPIGPASETGTSSLNNNPIVIITDYSVAIVWYGTYIVTFTKTQTGKNAVFSSGIGSGALMTMTYEDNVVSQPQRYENRQGILTQILPILFGSYNGEYTPHVYYAVRTQTIENKNFKEITLNNKKFLTNGGIYFEFD